MVIAKDTSAPIPIENSQLTMQLSAQEAALNNEGVTPERWHEALSVYEEFLTIVADHSRYTQGDGKAPKRVENNDEGQQKGTITPVGAN